MNVEVQISDHEKIWTTIGSAGTIDETDSGKVFFDHGIVQMGRLISDPLPGDPESTADADPLTSEQPAGLLFPPVSAVIRYNITPIDGLLYVQTPPCQPGTNCLGIQLSLRYLAAGSGAQVISKLIELDMMTGFETVRLKFDSDSFAAANHYQVQHVGECGPLWHFDFIGKAYYIEATLTTSSIIGNTAAGIEVIKISIVECLG